MFGKIQSRNRARDAYIRHGFRVRERAGEGASSRKPARFHGKVHNTSGRATIYKEADGQLVLRLTNFKTSNGPDVHVVSDRGKGRRRRCEFS